MNQLTADGLVRATGDDVNKFLQQMPSLVKLTVDGSYMKYCEKLHKQLKCVSAKIKHNLLAENDNMEEDEWRERVEALE